jgi:hypothetical protein
MRERYELALKIACGLLVVVLVVQVGRAVFSGNPVKNLKIPALPTLALAADSATNTPSANSGTSNAKGKTNRTDSASKGTNSGALVSNTKLETNSLTSTNEIKASTNLAAAKTSTDKKNGKDSAIVGAAKADTNSTPTASATSNAVLHSDSAKGGTNLVAVATNKSGTNSAKASKGPASRPDMAMMGGPMGRPGGKKAPDLAPPVQARVDKIVDSELLGPIIRPLPMALLGIAGNVAIIRSPSGQTGLVKEGDSLGELKLLRIGTNRVLVEQAGEKKELMIFSGYGGETLMPKEKDKTNETTNAHS